MQPQNSTLQAAGNSLMDAYEPGNPSTNKDLQAVSNSVLSASELGRAFKDKDVHTQLPMLTYPGEKGLWWHTKNQYHQDAFFKQILDFSQAFQNFMVNPDGFFQLNLYDW